ncbi:MAG TPA: zf-HC2 domain-containing protein [Terriglobia bacterium]|nr:zf-HC2 domain-containing protein [Terriglobia bacterium]
MELFELCQGIRGHFSDYLDGLCSPDNLRSLRYHLSYCEACSEELERWQAVRAGLRALPRLEVPQKRALGLRVALSQELHRNLLGRLWVRLENALRPVLLPASAGVALTAIVCFGLIMDARLAPAPAGADIPDVPVQIVTPPRVRTLAPLDFNTGDQPVVLVTQIDADGRVTNYQILSGQHSPELENHLDRMMYFSVFHPATMFGRPTTGRMVLSFRSITVRG